jgi:V8-like Glu-specific endopeptidase
MAVVIPVVLLAAMFLVPGEGGAAPPRKTRPPQYSAADVVGSSRLSAAQKQSTLDYWTKRRMRNAIPMKAAVPGEGASGLLSTAQPSGDGVTIEGSSGSGQTAGPPLSAGEAPVPAGYTYPFPFTRHNVDVKYTKSPYKTVGKMFFTQNSTDFVCSGASVVSSPNNSVYTAGHCVSDGSSTFSTNVVFVPARKNGNNPFGQFPGTQLWTTSAWHFSGDLTRDFAAFAVGTNGAGNTLQSRVGTLGFQYDQSRVQHWDAFGYPASGGFSGETMVTCKASHAVDDTAIPGGGPDPMGIGCDMTSGSSGGPWITMLKRGNFLNSVNSYKYPSTEPGAMYGPYFDILANQVRCAAATGGSTTC